MKKVALVLVCSLLSSVLAFGGDTLDLDNPEDAVKALRKTQCHLEDGKPAVFWWSGNAYSRVPGEKDRHLFAYQAMSAAITRTAAAKIA